MNEKQFAIHQVSSFENLESTLNRLAQNDDWEVFQVLPQDDRYPTRIILKAKKKKRTT